MQKWLLSLFLCIASLSAKTYSFSSEPIDVVIPCAPKDSETLSLSIGAIREFGHNIRRVIVLSKEPLTTAAEWFDEANFPFTKHDIALEIFHGNLQAATEFLEAPITRIGWIYQQLLKFYAPFVIPDLSNNVLILDADLIFFKPVQFTNELGGPLLTLGFPYECVPAYIAHAKRLLPDFERVNIQYSGIAHHMLFQKPLLEDLFADIRRVHQTEPWRAICRCIDTDELFACLSEYEIYFNYALKKTAQARFRQLRHIDASSIHSLSWYKRIGYDFAACHSWRRNP